MSDDLVIETRTLTKSYGATRALDGLELRVPRGAIFGLLGPNGAGKSTTIRLLLGLIQPTSGEVLLFGESLAKRRLQLLPRIGCLVEGPAFYPYLSGADNLQCLGDVAGGVSKDRVQACLEQVGLGERGKDKYRGYSTGMRQRLGLAGALLHDPELIILDEPLNGLDPPAVVLVRGLIQDLNAAGKTLFISSHLLNEVELTCNEVAIVQRGVVVAQGSVTELIRPDLARVDVHTGDVDQALEVARGLELVDTAEPLAGEVSGIMVVLADDQPALLNQALVEGGVSVAALIPHQRTLEELFHELAGAEQVKA